MLKSCTIHVKINNQQKTPHCPGNRVESVQGDAGPAEVRRHRTRVHLQHEKRAGRHGKRPQPARNMSHSLLCERSVFFCKRNYV